MYDRSTNSHFKWTKKWGAAQDLNEGISNYFRNRAVVRVNVKAGDNKHAEDKAMSVSRNSIDAINFFADLLVCVGKIIKAKSAVPERDRSGNQENSPRRA